jgi:hypothetical protein
VRGGFCGCGQSSSWLATTSPTPGTPGGDTAEAVALFRRALQFDPRLAKAHSNLGQLLLDRG